MKNKFLAYIQDYMQNIFWERALQRAIWTSTDHNGKPRISTTDKHGYTAEKYEYTAEKHSVINYFSLLSGFYCIWNSESNKDSLFFTYSEHIICFRIEDAKQYQIWFEHKMPSSIFFEHKLKRASSSSVIFVPPRDSS